MCPLQKQCSDNFSESGKDRWNIRNYNSDAMLKFCLVTQRVWAEPDKNPTSTIFYRPKPEPEFST